MKRARIVSVVAFVFACGAPVVAHAEGPSKQDAAAAQTLFNDARTLMKAGKFAEACPKLEESLRLDDGIGTKFNLADCHEHVGRLATAWAEFVETAAEAKRVSQPAREKIAKQRADALEPKLPKLELVVEGGAASGVEVKRDGVVVGSAAWGSPIPVDAGAHTIVATAPGKVRWEGSVTAVESKTAKLVVPRLDDEAVAVAPPPMSTTTTTSSRMDQPMIVDEGRGRTQRTAGWIVTGAGVAGLAVGGIFGLKSMGAKSDANDHCIANACDATGVSLRDDARSFGQRRHRRDDRWRRGRSLGGLVTVLTAPSTTSSTEKSTAIRATPFSWRRDRSKGNSDGHAFVVHALRCIAVASRRCGLQCHPRQPARRSSRPRRASETNPTPPAATTTADPASRWTGRTRRRRRRRHRSTRARPRSAERTSTNAMGSASRTTIRRWGCGSPTCSPCSLGHATATCAAKTCVISECDKGYADCDLTPSTGCEGDLSKSTSCGTCNTVCAPAAPLCAPGSDGRELCLLDGLHAGRSAAVRRTPASIPNSSDNNCGGCNVKCPTVANGTAVCTNASCGFTCKKNFHACGVDLRVGHRSEDVRRELCGLSGPRERDRHLRRGRLRDRLQGGICRLQPHRSRRLRERAREGQPELRRVREALRGRHRVHSGRMRGRPRRRRRPVGPENFSQERGRAGAVRGVF